ncbi:hypothetical protein FQN60_010284, partial [Etheostoma spectabile]
MKITAVDPICTHPHPDISPSMCFTIDASRKETGWTQWGQGRWTETKRKMPTKDVQHLEQKCQLRQRIKE